jgi:hypothetical protein
LLQDNLFNVVTRKAFQRRSKEKQVLQHLLQDKLCNIVARQAFKHPFRNIVDIDRLCNIVARQDNVVARQDNVVARDDMQHCCKADLQHSCGANFATLLRNKFFATFVSREALQHCCKTSFAIFLHASYSRCDGMNLRQSFPMFPSSVSLARYYAFH